MQKNLKGCGRRVLTSLLAALLVTGSCPVSPLMTADAVYTHPEGVISQKCFYFPWLNDPTDDFLMDDDPSTCWNVSAYSGSVGMPNGDDWISGYCCVDFNVGSYLNYMYGTNDPDAPERTVTPSGIVLTTADSDVFEADAVPVSWTLYGYNNDSGGYYDDPGMGGSGHYEYDEYGNEYWVDDGGGDPGYYGGSSTEWIYLTSDTMYYAEPATDYSFYFDSYQGYSRFLFVVDQIANDSCECCQLAELRLIGSTSEWGSIGLTYDDTDGSYLIQSASDWDTLKNAIENQSSDDIWWDTKTFKLTNDITVNSTIGSEEFPFNSVFDGNGHTITYSGSFTLFARTDSSAVIKNLTLNSLNDSGITCNTTESYTYLGSIVGYNKGVVMNCTNNAPVVLTGNDDVENCCTGGIVGFNYNGKIINCVNNANVTGFQKVGGIVGYDYSDFQMYTGSTAVIGCTNNGCVALSIDSPQEGDCCGGIIGYLGCADDSSGNEEIKHHVVANVTRHDNIIGGCNNENYSANISNFDVRCNYTTDENAVETTEIGGLYRALMLDIAQNLSIEFPSLAVFIDDYIGQTTLADVREDYSRFTLVEHPDYYFGNGETVWLDITYNGDTPDGYRYVQGNTAGNFTEGNLSDTYGYYDGNNTDTWYYADIPSSLSGMVTVEPYSQMSESTITFNTNGGSTVSPITQAVGTAVTAPANPTKEGYTFDGWEPELPETMPANDMTVTAKWKANRYTITFDTAGGTALAPITKEYGETITAPENPTKTGYTFAGWSNEIPSTMPAENITITANWTVNQYTITFDTNGGSTVDSITQDYGTAVTAPENPTKTGYTFAGWNNEIPSTMPAENITITANWTVNQYTITFDTNGGSEIPAITQDYGTAVTAPENPTKEGYTFTGWDKAIPTTMPAEDMTITAHWAVNPHTVTFKNDDGSVISTVTRDYGETITPPAAPEKEGYTFAGWNPELPTTMPDEDITVTAQWTPKQYTITFNTDGGTEIAPITQNYGTAVTAPENPTKTGYTFASWDKAIPTTMPAESITITANWTVNQYTITFMDGETILDTITQDYNTAVTAPENPTKTGYTFTGWEPECPAAMPAENKTLTAQWQINQYTITFDTNGGSTVDSITQDYGTAVTAPENPTKDGYIFSSWSPSLPETMPAENMTVAAIWEEDPHFADTERTDWIKEGVDTGFDWSISEGKLTIYGDGGMPSMPSASDYPWASLAQYITKITIDSGIINIADNAFCSAGNIQYLKLRIVCLPDTVTEIGENAFSGAVNLNELDWKYNEDFDPDVTIIIKSNAFKGCVILDVTLMVIQTNNSSGAGTGAFEGCIKARIVIFGANGGTGTQAGISADENGIITLPVCTYHSPGERFDFAGWLVNGNIYYPNESVQISEDITVTAQWKKWVLVHAYTRTKTSSDSFYDISSFDIPHINYSGDTVTLTALNKRAQGYSFMGWYTVVSEENGIVTAYGELVSDMLNYSFRLGEDDLQLVAVYKANEKSQLNIFSVNGAQYRIDDKSTIRMGSSHTVPIGTKVTVTAVDPQKVLEWISGNNQIIGKGESVTVEVAGQKNLSLVYRSEIPNQSFVQFVSDYQQVMQFDQVSSEDDIIIPAGPSKLGYVFDHWVFEGTNDTADAETIKAKISTESVITLKPAYVASNQQFTVTVNYVDKDGNALQETTSASVNVGTTYQITAPVIDGNQAAYWKDSSGNIICYGENCFRLVKEDITLTACYVPENEEVQAQPVITLGDFSVADVDGAHKILCTATRNMPSTGYHVKANGILVCKNPDQLTESNFTYENIDGTVILNAPNSYNTINGTFTLTLNVQDDDMLVAFRGYMIVEDSVTGTQNIYYSDIKQTNYSSVNIGE